MSKPVLPRFTMKFFDADGNEVKLPPVQDSNGEDLIAGKWYYAKNKETGNEMIARLYTDPLFGMPYWAGESAADVLAHSVVFVPVEVFNQSGEVV